MDAVPTLPTSPGVIEARVYAELVEVERADTVEGLLALSLARDLDAGAVAPGQRGTAGQKLLAVLGTALEGTAPAVRDRLDDLADRRRARAASA